MKNLLIVAMFVAVLAILIVFGLPRFPRQELVAQRPQASPSPSPWNSGAIQSTFVGAQVQEVDATHATLEFFTTSITTRMRITGSPKAPAPW